MATTQNSSWVKYGIEEEGSDWRAHVCPFGLAWQKAIYFFPSASGISAMKRAIGDEYGAGQDGFEGHTGKGVRVPWDEIEGCVQCHLPGWAWQGWSWKMTTSQKGHAAHNLVLAAMAECRLDTRLPFYGHRQARDVSSSGLGWDIEVISDKLYKIEVKADLPANSKGGLFLQSWERNPLGLY